MKLDQLNGMITTDINMWAWLRNLHLSKNIMALSGVDRVGGGWDIPNVALQTLNNYSMVYE